MAAEVEEALLPFTYTPGKSCGFDSRVLPSPQKCVPKGHLFLVEICFSEIHKMTI